MGSRVLTACSFRSKSIPQQVFHRCRSAEALRLFRVPAVYLTSAFLWFLSILLFRRINNFVESIPPRGSTPTPGTNFFFLFNRLRSAILKSFARFSFVVCLTVPNFVPIAHRLVFCCFRSLCGSHLLTKAAPAETLITLE